MPQADPADKSVLHVWNIPIQAVSPNPRQPRRAFDSASLDALAASIREVGLLQPITVRAVDGARYELIAGERRLRACRKLGLSSIDALVLGASESDSALLALVENLQREDLHYLDEAEGYAMALRACGITQEALAARIGRSQSAVANKLRLLKLAPEVLAALRETSLTERHARALLRLPLPALQLDAAGRMAEQKLSVRQGDALVTSLLAALPGSPWKPVRRVISLARDPRLYINAIRDIVRQMEFAGIPAQMEVADQPGGMEIRVRVTNRGANAEVSRHKRLGAEMLTVDKGKGT